MRSMHSQFRFALDIEAVDALLQRVLDFLARLADSCERALGWIAAGREHTKQFAAGNDVETSARVSEQLQNRAIRVCFDCITDQVIERLKRSIESRVVIENCSRAVNISRRAEFLRDAGKIDIFAVEMYRRDNETNALTKASHE